MWSIFLYICLIAVGLKLHLVLVTSAHYCWWITHLLVFVHQLIITLNLRFLKMFFHKRHQRFLMLRRIIGLVLTFFYVGKTVHKINVSVKVRIFPLNMCDIIIFAAQWWEKYLSKRSLLKHTCSWRDNLLYYEYWTEEQKYFHVKCVTVLNQFDLIILFAEVFVRIFCHHFYLVSFDFLFLLEQTAKVISKR